MLIPVQLPITLKSFTGETQNKINTLHWTVSQETNLLNYNLQKSNDGINFNTITTIKAKSTGNEVNYNYVDTKPFTGANYYRLKSNDIDSKFSYSNIVKLFIKGSDINIYPNPAAENVTIEMKNTQFSVQLIDANGKTVYRNINAKNKLIVNTQLFANGYYIVEITTANGIKQTQKINIIH